MDKAVSEVIDFLPRNFTEVGKQVKTEKVKKFTSEFRIHSIDNVIDRPFIECLLMSFYFASSAELEIKLVELVQRCVS